MPAAAKVIAFDGWTEGAQNLVPLVDVFASKGLALSLLHIGSWGHDKNRPTEEDFGSLHVRDIAFYERLTLPEILERERPAAILFQSTQAFAHRALNRYCHHAGIPTVHLYHGLNAILDLSSSDTLNPVSVRRQAWLVLSRSAKNLSIILPVYARALWDTGAELTDWAWLLYDVWRKIVGSSYNDQAAPDASTSACCVYTEADIPHAIRRYRMSPQSVHVVGNPDLAKFGLSDDEVGSCLNMSDSPAIDVVYIDTAFGNVGAVFPTEESFIEHILATRDVLNRSGLRLVVKLHPSHSRTIVPTRLFDHGVALASKEDFVSTLRSSLGVIAEPSSLAIVPALMGLPVALARYGPLSGQSYGGLLKTYPQAAEVFSIEDAATTLTRLRDRVDRVAVAAWIRAQTGPLPSTLMPWRVAGVCKSVIESCSKTAEQQR